MILVDNKTFRLNKNTYPFSYTVSANRLVRYSSVVKKQYFPEEIWAININGDKLDGTFDLNKNLAGSLDHYIFSGEK